MFFLFSAIFFFLIFIVPRMGEFPVPYRHAKAVCRAFPYLIITINRLNDKFAGIPALYC
jgi:hypothetical protein